jgi:hypothetical protein
MAANDEKGWEKQKEEEDRYREMFARAYRGGESAEIGDPHLLLLNVFAERERFRVREETAEEKAIPHLFLPLHGPAAVPQAGSPGVVEKEEFLRRWQQFSRGLLDGLNWDNVFVAGKGDGLLCPSCSVIFLCIFFFALCFS